MDLFNEIDTFFVGIVFENVDLVKRGLVRKLFWNGSAFKVDFER